MALEDARAEIVSGEEQRLIDMIDNAPLGPIETQWGLGFRGYDECVDYIRANGIEAPEGGVVLPLRYTVYERSTHSVVPSNAIWRDPAHADSAAILRGSGELAQRRPQLYFPQVMRDARRIGEYYPGLSPTSPECMDRLGVSPSAATSSPRARISTIWRRWSACSTSRDQAGSSSSHSSPGATDALVYNHDVFDKGLCGRSHGKTRTPRTRV